MAEQSFDFQRKEKKNKMEDRARKIIVVSSNDLNVIKNRGSDSC